MSLNYLALGLGGGMRRNVILGIVAALLATPVGASLYRAGDSGTRTFLWDPASHALNGLRMADGILRARPLEFLKELLVPHHYPPGHSLFQTPFYLVMGRTTDAARMASVAAFVALLALAVILARKCGSDAFVGPVVFLTVAASSPHFLTCAAVPMLEIFAGLGLVAFALVYGWSREKPDDAGRAYAAAATATAVYLTTTNFAMILFAAVAVFEALEGDRRRSAAAVRRFFAGYRPLNLWIATVCVLTLAAGVVAVTGGGRVGKVSVTSPASPLAIALGVAGLHLAIELWKRREGIRQWPVRLRALLWVTVVPIVAWFVIYPPRLRVTLDFFQGGGSGGTPLVDRLPRYPVAWIGQFHLSAALAMGAALALASALVFRKRLNEWARFTAVLAAVGTAALFAHPMHDLRFFTALLPLYWALLAAELGRWTAGRWLLRAAIGLALVATAWPAWAFHRDDLGGRIARQWYAEEGLAEALRFAARAAAESPGSVRVLGTAPGLSHHAVEFEIRKLRGMDGLAYDVEMPGSGKGGPRADFDRWLSKRPEDRVVTLEPGENVPGLDDRWESVRDYASFLEAEPRYRLAGDASFPARRLRVRVWDRRAPPAVP